MSNVKKDATEFIEVLGEAHSKAIFKIIPRLADPINDDYVVRKQKNSLGFLDGIFSKRGKRNG